MMSTPAHATALQLWGAFSFGAVLGWYLYFVNRYRKDAVALTDLATLLGAVGGGAVLALFPAGTDLFGAYGVGLAAGFFLYFIALCVMVWASPNFDRDWFLDGRRKSPAGDQTNAGAEISTHPMVGGGRVTK
jgi:hypothetical protein